MPSPRITLWRLTVQDILEFRRFLPDETVQEIEEAIERDDREYDQAQMDREEKNHSAVHRREV